MNYFLAVTTAPVSALLQPLRAVETEQAENRSDLSLERFTFSRPYSKARLPGFCAVCLKHGLGTRPFGPLSTAYDILKPFNLSGFFALCLKVRRTYPADFLKVNADVLGIFFRRCVGRLSDEVRRTNAV
uniref:Putative secreted protein n=1 Tax=Ixodes ricinus TaxID=34613 RepID=A0A6B0URP9_IXORI